MEENKKKRKEPKLATKLLNIKHQKIVEEKDNVDLNKPVKITLSRKVRWFLFSILIYLTLVMDLDQGILSSTTDSISKDLELNSNELGGLGSMVFLGKSLGCLLFFTLINQLNRKYMLLINTVFLIFSLILTTQTKKLMLLYISRIIAGLTQSYLSIYLPVWTDQFGIHKHKSMMMACNHLASSLGSLFGYVFGYSFGWKLGFYIQNILIMIPVVIIIFIKNKFFSMSLMPVKSKMKLADIVEDKENKESDKLEKEKSKEEKEEEKKEDQNNLKDDISLFEDIQKNGEGNTQGSIKLQILSIIKSPIFILINITLCSIYIIVAAVQFWINDYLQNNLKIEDAGSRLAMFGGVVLTAFPIGMIVGGIALTKIGGYESEKAIYIPLVFSLITSIFANLAPLSSNVYIFLPLFWIFFFAGSAIIPAANTISLVSVEKKFAGAASSSSILIYNVLGRFPGPNIYASFKSLINDNKSRIPMLLLLNISFIGFIATLIALKFNKQKFIKLREELLKKEKEEKEKENNIVEEEEILKIDEDNENNKEDKIEENENKEMEEEGEEKEKENNI